MWWVSSNTVHQQKTQQTRDAKRLRHAVILQSLHSSAFRRDRTLTTSYSSAKFEGTNAGHKSSSKEAKQIHFPETFPVANPLLIAFRAVS